METSLEKSILSICELLHKHHVQYMIIGGTAVALNGYYRHSVNPDGSIIEKPDIDIWYSPTYGNYYKILDVLKDLDQDIAAFEEEQTPDPLKSFFKIDFPGFNLDLLPRVKADIKFRTAHERKETIKMNDIYIHFMNYIDLIEDKKVMARAQDIEDIKQLQKRRGL